MKRIYTFLLLACAGLLQAQQVGMYNHYFFKPFIYNPAFAGQGEGVQAMLLSHTQWVGFKNAPQAYLFTLDGAVKEDKVGLGLTLVSERRGINQRNGGSAAYSYRLKINNDAHLLFGLSAGVVNQTLDYSKAVAENYNDPTLFWGAQQKTTFDANAGLGVVWKGLRIGFSVPQVLGNKVNYAEDTTETKTFYKHERHYLGSLGYKFFISEEKGISITPQALVRIVPNTPLQFEGNLNLEWQDKFWIGATYKSNYAVAANAGICINKKLYVGYSYDVIIGSIGKYAGISHEIMVNFKFGTKKKEEALPDNPLVEEPKVVDGAEGRIDSLQEQLDASNEKIRQLRNRMDEQARLQQQTQEQLTALQNSQAANANNANAANTNTAIDNSSVNSSANQATGDQNTGGKQNKGTKSTKVQSGGNQNPSTSDQKVVNEYSTDPGVNKSGLALKQHDKEEIEKNVGLAGDRAGDYKNSANAIPKPGFYVVVGTFFYRDFAQAEMGRFINRGYAGTSWIYSEPRQFNYIYTGRLDAQEQAVTKVKELHAKGYTDAWILQLK